MSVPSNVRDCLLAFRRDVKSASDFNRWRKQNEKHMLTLIDKTAEKDKKLAEELSRTFRYSIWETFDRGVTKLLPRFDLVFLEDVAQEERKNVTKNVAEEVKKDLLSQLKQWLKDLQEQVKLSKEEEKPAEEAPAEEKPAEEEPAAEAPAEEPEIGTEDAHILPASEEAGKKGKSSKKAASALSDLSDLLSRCSPTIIEEAKQRGAASKDPMLSAVITVLSQTQEQSIRSAAVRWIGNHGFCGRCREARIASVLAMSGHVQEASNALR